MRKWLLGLAIVCMGCARRPPLPALPSLSMDGFVPAVRVELQKAFDSARAHPEDAAAAGKLGMLLQAHEQYRAAEDCYRRATLLAPGTFDWTYYLGVVQAAQGRNAEAAASFEQALRRRPDYVPAQLQRADALLAQGDLEAAARIYARYPDSPAALYGLGRVQSARGETQAAIESLRKACELFPAYGAAHYALSVAYRRAGSAELAAQHSALHEKNKLTVPPANDPLLAAVRALNAGAGAQVREGVRLEQSGRLREAAEAHEKALAIDPNMAQAHVNLISLYGRLGERDRALEHFRAAIALNPNLAEAYYNYGVLLHHEGKLAEARRAYGQALDINPAYAEAHHNLGDILQREGKLQEAAAHFKKAIASKPDFRLARFSLARILANGGAYQPAIQQLLQTLTPDDEATPTYLYALGAIYARAGNRASALEYVRRARAEAAARGQTQLLASIERDLRSLEGAR